MSRVAGGESAEYVYTARRNNSLYFVRTAVRLRFHPDCFAGHRGSGFPLVFGAWPILPFAGVEMAVLYLAFRYMDRHAADYERITIRGDDVAVEVHEGRKITRLELHRCWAQVVCANDGSAPRAALARPRNRGGATSVRRRARRTWRASSHASCGGSDGLNEWREPVVSAVNVYRVRKA